MNPTRAPSRFIRGRARGGGAYRPYFYFRRQGRVIPATGTAADGDAPAVGRGRSRGRGFRKRSWGTGNRRPSANTSDANNPPVEGSFLRAEHYAAPENSLQVQSIAVSPMPICPGWQLYFGPETYAVDSELSKRIRALQTHYKQYPTVYDLGNVQRQGYFALHATVVTTTSCVTDVWPTLQADLIAHPQRTLATCAVAMHALLTSLSNIENETRKSSSREYYVSPSQVRKIYARPLGFMPLQLLSQLCHGSLDSLCCVRGVVTAMGSVELAASWVAYKCGRCAQEQVMRQSGGYHVSRPYCCKRVGCSAKSGFVEQRSSPFTRITPRQIIRLAENNVQAEKGAFIDVELCYDLVDSVYPGQEVIVYGMLKRRTLADEVSTSLSEGSPEFYLKACAMGDAERVPHDLSERDLQAISTINGEADSFKLLVHSLAPELHGQELVKASTLLALVGGAGSQLHEGSEIHVLLVGDPGIGKSHLLQMCVQVAGKAALMSGKSGIGGTCNSLMPNMPSRPNYALNAGALVTALKGHCVIDDVDRVAAQQDSLLQILQSQTLCIPTSSVFAAFNPKTAVIASANSTRGHYDQSRLLSENIRMQPALLNQFHLVFLMLDKPDKDFDFSLTEHVRAKHMGIKKTETITTRFALKPKTNHSIVSLDDAEAEDDENYNLEQRLKLTDVEQNEIDLLPPILLRKFIAYTREKMEPLLTDAAAADLKSFYLELRKQKENEKFNSIGINQFEAIIRLSQARARIDLSNEVTKIHSRDILCLMRQSIANTEVGNYVDINPATASSGSGGRGGGSQNKNIRKFLQTLHMRAQALGQRMFDFDELKDVASHAGISCEISSLVDIVNMQGLLLKKGPNLYQVMEY